MAIPSGPCDSGSEACCVSLYDVAAHLLTECYEAINECYPAADCCEALSAYVTMGRGDDGVVDSLVVAFGNIRTDPGSTPGVGFATHTAQFDIILRESGWPTVALDAEGAIVLPAPAEQHAAARHAYSHAEAMYRRLAYLQNTRGLTPPGTPCTRQSLGTMTPLNPQGGVVGWQVPVFVQMGWSD